ncbi:BnaC08g46070D [Brassica napus]|uniref:(rape) hypothetical protein n=1 Tax=Brassica napus TaxID=3708 RepID=A0A078HJE7_BRANA|nr:unnamed protein product [Brassica napus]CDY37469.1 BnaC08g46070D [Brassica napus]
MSLAEAQQRTLTQPFDLRLRLSPPEISQRQLHEQAQMRSFIQERALKQPSPAQGDKTQQQLHTLI